MFVLVKLEKTVGRDTQFKRHHLYTTKVLVFVTKHKKSLPQNDTTRLGVDLRHSLLCGGGPSPEVRRLDTCVLDPNQSEASRVSDWIFPLHCKVCPTTTDALLRRPE